MKDKTIIKNVKRTRRHALPVLIVAVIVGCSAVSALASDPLGSWNDGEAKQSIIEFVSTVSKQGSSDFVPPAERIAVFDNDGTLWAEQPMYFQVLFAIDRVKALAPQHPEWQEKEPFASLLKGDLHMLQWTTAGKGPRFALYVHHTDAEREWAYDRKTSFGCLDKGLDEAKKNGWTVVDMKQDWKVIYPYETR
jgi:hypothetical protein